MRLSSLLIRAGTFGLAAVVATFAASAAVSSLEKKTVMQVQEALIDADMTWTSVLADGLQVVIEGEAPDEVARLRAVNVAGGVVDASRVISNMSVADQLDIEAPDFSVEILRNDSGIYLIGLIPADTNREELNARLQDIADGQEVSDLMETADYPQPETWRRSLNLGLRALDLLPRSKISVSAGEVDVTASTDSNEEKRQALEQLNVALPEGIELALTINAPRPVVSPYITRFIIDEDGSRFDACTADTETARQSILSAAEAAGFDGNVTCALALGVPSRTWGDAVAMSISALSDLGGGTLTVSDADITLVAAAGTSPAVFDRVVGELENALPDLFALDATLPPAPSEEPEGPPQFTATLSPEGIVQLRGKIPDDLTNTVVENYARARFAGDEVTMGTRIEDGLPNDWQVRVLASIEALSHLANGAVTVEPNRIDVRGNSGDEETSAAVSGLLVEKLGSDATFLVDVNYVPQLDLVIDETPTPEECVNQINLVTVDRKITFDPGSATLSADALPIMDDIAEILSQCIDLEIEVAGYTDSQGSEEMNQNLSQQRAEAVLSALRMRRVPTSSFVAAGYGEADPIADNDTEEGREANRRIEFHLVPPDPVDEAPTTLELNEAPADAAPADTIEE